MAFDVEALLRGIIIGMGTGFIITAITKAVLRLRWGIVMLLGIGVALILAVTFFYLWPSLVEVPNLSNLSRAEAELLLAKKRLVPEIRPQHAAMTEAGRVVPYSQEPAAGIKVHKGTVIRFAVSLTFKQLSETNSADIAAAVSIFKPKSGEEANCRQYGDGVYRLSVEGMSKGVAGGGGKLQLLLWVKPVDPPSEIAGWYLQRPPVNGISLVEPDDGTWRGIAQVGNAQWPPHKGDILDVAITVVDTETAQRLLGAPGIVTRIDLPGFASDKALNVKVTLK